MTLPSGSQLGHAEALRVGHLLEQDLRRGRLGVGAAGLLERVDERPEVLLQQVVAEVHHEVVVAEEVLGDEHAVGQPERCVLGQVGDSAPKPAPSPTAAITSAFVSPTMMPISLMPAATMASSP
jgi:hypothetical protein